MTDQTNPDDAPKGWDDVEPDEAVLALIAEDDVPENADGADKNAE